MGDVYVARPRSRRAQVFWMRVFNSESDSLQMICTVYIVHVIFLHCKLKTRVSRRVSDLMLEHKCGAKDFVLEPEMRC